MLMMFGFDCECPGTVACIERYLHILRIDDIPIILQMVEQVCKFALNEPHFLNYKPSQLAACACILSNNIYRRDMEQLERESDQGWDKKSFFQLSD